MIVQINRAALGLGTDKIWSGLTKQLVEYWVRNIFLDYDIQGTIVWGTTPGVVGFDPKEDVDPKAQIDILELFQRIVVHNDLIVESPKFWGNDWPNVKYEFTEYGDKIQMRNNYNDETISLGGSDAEAFVKQLSEMSPYQQRQLSAQTLIEAYFEIAALNTADEIEIYDESGKK